MNEKMIAIVLAGGQGSRMRSDIPKQYLLLEKKPLLVYSLLAFEQSTVDEIILVTRETEISYCQTEIVEKYGISKVKAIIAGGAERSDSVFAGLKSCKNCDYVLIHDGARPFLTVNMIEDSIKNVKKYKACVLGVKVKDTIKISNQEGYVNNTPNREYLWAVQTPQSFSYALIFQAYQMLMESEYSVTDDAMAVEIFMKQPVKLIEGSYNNIKITTQEDLCIAQQFINS